ncbi:MAG TPA: hypothetical protein VMB52_03895 [Verrucomicrobiae bacterium]|nr:hypothetical protein [Verrucomicrobiae bacterium]
MDYEGVIIEESLKDKAVLQAVKIISTQIEPASKAHNTPWLKQWTLHTVRISAEQADTIAERLRASLDRNCWYADFKNDTTHYIIFSDKIFQIDRRNIEAYEAATNHGLRLRIPSYQLDFVPNTIHWERPDITPDSLANKIETLPAVQSAVQVLRRLKQRGLREPAIASGWTRGYLVGIEPSDIDVAYVGLVAPKTAQRYIRETLAELNLDPTPWDIAGIWNAQLAYGVTHTVENYLLYYVDSIDTVYLGADGKLHDPTGYGFTDAAAKILRINTYDSTSGRRPTAQDEVYVCLEGCRRIAKFGWTPTTESIDRIRRGASRWHELSATEQTYYIRRKVIGKYSPKEYDTIRPSYDTYGWGFVFDKASQAL